MPRIRTLKPEFWADEKLGPLDPLTRLVFLGLISQADDAGRLVDSVRQLNGLLFPYTDDTCADALEILARLSRVSRYTSESGQRLIQIVGWKDHQRVDKPAKHVLPPPSPEGVATQGVATSSRHPRDILATSSRSDLRPTTYDHVPKLPLSGTGTAPVPDLWRIWLERFGGEGRQPKLTAARSLALRRLWDEQLKSEAEPLVVFSRVLDAVQASEHHMSKREYQFPDSLFRSDSRRDRWVNVAMNGQGSAPRLRAGKFYR